MSAWNSYKELLPSPDINRLRVKELDELISIVEYDRSVADQYLGRIPDRSYSVYLAWLDERIDYLRKIRISKSKNKQCEI